MQHPISWLVQEIDSIQVEQKAVSCVSEKAKWWEGRRTLDSRVEVSAEERGYLKLYASTQTCRPRIRDTETNLSVKFWLRNVTQKFLKPPIFLSATVEGDGGIAGMLEELSSTPFIGSWALQSGPAPSQVLVCKGSDSQWGHVEGVCRCFFFPWTFFCILLVSKAAGKGTDKATTTNTCDLCFRLCCLPLLCSPKTTLKDLLWEFLHSGTRSVTSFSKQLCPGSLTETSPTATWFSSWTRLVSLSLLNTECSFSLICT